MADYSYFEQALIDFDLNEYELRAGLPLTDRHLLEKRFNPNHDPDNGRFCSGKGIDKSAESGIIKIRNEFKSMIKGTRAANGVTVNEISTHATERMIQRKVSSVDVKEALSNPYVTYRSKTDAACSVFDRGRTHVVLNDDGKIITVAVNE